MNVNVEYLKKIFALNNDFNIREIELNKKDKIYITYFESLCDSKSIYNYIIKGINNNINRKNFKKEVSALLQQ